MLIDSLSHKGLRHKMAAELQTKGITQPAVLRAMAMVPRHCFMDSTMLAREAYKLQALPLSYTDWREPEQTMSHPLTVAIQTQLLQVQTSDKILEIGTGRGYQTAILCAMGVRSVFSIERQHALHSFAKNILSELNYAPTLIFGDGFEGLPQYAPFNKIIVTCGAADIPAKLQQQLSVDGIMVIPVRRGEWHNLLVVRRTKNNSISVKNCGRYRDFVPMLVETKI